MVLSPNHCYKTKMAPKNTIPLFVVLNFDKRNLLRPETSMKTKEGIILAGGQPTRLEQYGHLVIEGETSTHNKQSIAELI